LQIRIAPIIKIYALVAVSLVLAALVIGAALDQRYLGLRLTPEIRNADAVPFDGVWIDAVIPGGPAADSPDAGIPEQGASLASLTDASGNTIPLSPADLVEEPDTLESFSAMRAFFERQDRIAAVLRNGPVTLDLRIDGQSQLHRLQPARQRPLGNLPFVFWLQIVVGLGGVWIGAWVWALRRSDWAARCLAFSGVGLMISAYAAAVYSTRELALPGHLFRSLSALNQFGALSFGVGMIGLFMVYPRRLFQPQWLAVPAIVLGTWFGLSASGKIETTVISHHLAIVSALLSIIALVAVQYRATRGDPRDRAALSWLGLSVLIGSGAFVVTVIAPHLLGLDAYMSQGIAFAFFLLVYVGVALGVARFQLFQLENWAFRILFYVVGVLLLLGIDALLIFTVVDDRAPAFAMSLLIVALAWLPLRDTIARWLLHRKEPARAERFRKIMDVALTPQESDPLGRWQALLDDMFTPLSVASGADVSAPALRYDGLALALPRIGPLPAIELQYADHGRRLFSVRDLELATEMTTMLEQALESREAYERGVTEERTRIARDIHDNIGLQLMAALHSPEQTRKDLMIRETLTDLREIINNASNPDLSFDEMLADLRAQIAEQLLLAGVTMNWQITNAQGVALPLQTAHMLRSIIREAVQNALKHAEPTHIAVSVRVSHGRILVSVTNDGKGFEPKRAPKGNGLANLGDRAQAVGGAIHIDSSASGTCIAAEIPIGMQARGDI